MEQSEAAYVPLHGSDGRFIGIWGRIPDHPNLKKRLEMFAIGEGLPREVFTKLATGDYRRVENGRCQLGNNVTILGGSFLMTAYVPAPNETGGFGQKAEKEEKEGSKILTYGLGIICAVTFCAICGMLVQGAVYFLIFWRVPPSSTATILVWTSPFVGVLALGLLLVLWLATVSLRVKRDEAREALSEREEKLAMIEKARERRRRKLEKKQGHNRSPGEAGSERGKGLIRR